MGIPMGIYKPSGPYKGLTGLQVGIYKVSRTCKGLEESQLKGSIGDSEPIGGYRPHRGTQACGDPHGNL